jgi:hypothetical protein
MATIATNAATIVGIYGFPGVQPELRLAKELASQTFKVGAFLNTSIGFARQHTADNDGSIIGMAVLAGQNNATNGAVKSQYAVMTPALLMEQSFLGAANATHALAQADLWVGVQLQRATTTLHEVLDATTTVPRVMVVQIELDGGTAGANRGIITDLNARVYTVPQGSLCVTHPDI